MTKRKALEALRTMVVVGMIAPPVCGGRVHAETYFVRQTVGNDANDGHSPETAWQHISGLSAAMGPGDVAYVGPGLYREEITVQNDGTIAERLTFVADTTGQHTGDPPGVVMVTGADPVDEGIFAATESPGMYTAVLPFQVWGVVEMDGPQYRYLRVTMTKEYLVDKMPPEAIVARTRSSHHYDEAGGRLYIHTSDDRPPSAHEIEIVRRGAGIAMRNKRYVTIAGFTFRHVQDGGIVFFKGTSDGIAIGNTAYGSRQGIRVYGATNISLYGNTLFRNENSGAYFAAESFNGVAIGNVAYENVKGLRFGSGSQSAVVADNVLFDNSERGLSLEEVERAVLRGNTLVNNAVSQLLVLRSGYSSESNCFQNGGADQLVADFYPFPQGDRFKTLAEYRQSKRQDSHSREGGCHVLPQKFDVGKLHRDAMVYTEQARRILSGAPPGTSRGKVPAGSEPGGFWERMQRWLGW